MKFKLPDSVASSQDLSSLIQEVHVFTSWFTHEAIKRRAGAKKAAEPPVVSPATTELIRFWRTQQPLSSTSLDSLIKILENYRKTAPMITITLAAPASVGVKKTLVGWFRQNIAPDTLINFQFNSILLGGMVVRIGSHVYDWSFRRQILANRHNFPEALRHV